MTISLPHKTNMAHFLSLAMKPGMAAAAAGNQQFQLEAGYNGSQYILFFKR